MRIHRHVVLVLAFSLSACDKLTYQKLDEVLLYDSAELQLKVVLYTENLPFHYSGESYRVMCRSTNTVDSPAHATQDRGWVTIGNGSAIGTQTASDLSDKLMQNYRVQDSHIVFYSVNWLFRISFDGCGSFSTWDATSLPEDFIIHVKRGKDCKPTGSKDCRYEDFQGARQPRFTNIYVNKEREILFQVESAAFKNNIVYCVKSSNYGKTWQVAMCDSGNSSVSIDDEPSSLP